MLDIDFFKKINDQYGHLVGDEVLQELSRRITSVIRRDEVFARYGGEDVGNDGAIHGPGAGPTQALDMQSSVFEQTVEDAPGEGAMGAPALQREVDPDRHPATARTSRHRRKSSFR